MPPSGPAAPAPPPALPPDEASQDTPIFKLRQPLKIQSAVLGEVIYLAANDAIAEPLRQAGPIVYTARESHHLQAVLATVPPDQIPERLRLLHEAKRATGGTIIENGTATPASPTASSPPGDQ
jgi:hypothetical protein